MASRSALISDRVAKDSSPTVPAAGRMLRLRWTARRPGYGRSLCRYPKDTGEWTMTDLLVLLVIFGGAFVLVWMLGNR